MRGYAAPAGLISFKTASRPISLGWLCYNLAPATVQSLGSRAFLLAHGAKLRQRQHPRLRLGL